MRLLPVSRFRLFALRGGNGGGGSLLRAGGALLRRHGFKRALAAESAARERPNSQLSLKAGKLLTYRLLLVAF